MYEQHLPFYIQTETCPNVSNFKWVAYGNTTKFYHANGDHVVTMRFVRVKIFNYLLYIYIQRERQKERDIFSEKIMVISMFGTRIGQSTNIF